MIDVEMEVKDRIENASTSLARSCFFFCSVGPNWPLFLLMGFSIATCMVAPLRVFEGLKFWCAHVCYALSRVKQF